MTGPTLPPSGSPFGALAPYVAAIIALLIVVAAVIDHVLEALGRVTTSDPFLDSAALLVIGVVLGVGVIGSTASSALTSAAAAHSRLDRIGAPPPDSQPPALG